MKYYTTIIVLLLMVTSCQHNEKKKEIVHLEQKENKKRSYSSLTLYNTLNEELVLDTIEDGRRAQFSPLYIGEIKDSIKLNYRTATIKQATMNWGAYKNPKVADLEIFIDTTKTIGFPMEIWSYHKVDERRVHKKSYPVFIKNITSDTLSIGLGDIITLVTEAKDTAGEWRQLETPFMYMCGTGLTTFYLPPNQIMITALRENYGDAKTMFRVRYRSGGNKIYSNEIEGTIYQ